MRAGWEWDLAIPTRSVGSGIVRRTWMTVLGVLLGRVTFRNVIINIVVRYFWMWSFFALRSRWGRGCGSTADRRSKEPRSDGKVFQGFGGSCTQVLVVILEIPQRCARIGSTWVWRCGSREWVEKRVYERLLHLCQLVHVSKVDQ